MKNKKLISLVITGAIMVGYTPSIFALETQKVVEPAKVEDKLIAAATKISKEEAIKISKEILKTYFNTEIDEKKFNYNINLREDYYNRGKDNFIWDISWNMNSAKQYFNSWASINANDGKVISINIYKGNAGETPSISKITEEEAKKVAENFIKKINPKEFKEVQLNDNAIASSPYDLYNYNFNFIRKANGITFDGNYITVQVNGAASEVTGYNFNWDDNIQLPSKDADIDVNKANKLLKDNIKMNLNYRIPVDKYGQYDNVLTPKLVYVPTFKDGQMVDAKDGKLINPNVAGDGKVTYRDLTEKEKEEFYSKSKEVKNFEKELDRESAEKIIKQTLKDVYSKDLEISNISYRDVQNNYGYYQGNNKAWSATFKGVGGNNYTPDDGFIEINAENGAILSIRRYYYPEKVVVKPTVSKEDAYKKAIELIGKYYPDKVKQIKTEQSFYDQTYYINGKESAIPRYYFNFARSVNGITFMENNISVAIDSETGELLEISCNWSNDIKFPTITRIVSEDEAKELYANTYSTELQYSKVNVSKDTKKPVFEAKLVYKPVSKLNGNLYGEYINIDAVTGRPVDYSGNEIDNNINAFKEKIKGNKYEKELLLLAKSSIIDTKTFDSSKVATRLDLIKMLVNAKGYRPYILRDIEDLKFKSGYQKGEENYNYLQMAVSYNIIENTEGDIDFKAELTREEVAKYLVKALGYEDLAKVNKIFVLQNKDSNEVDQNLKGYVSIVEGLNLMDLKDGNFKPKEKTTMLELAVSVYNSLGKLQRAMY
ncbi:peptidase propeptide and YPEB domain protein [Clostridium homopropionicum DSM 5847]|uniref:Peptidase propeptide and YPEB domain protein n=1 Tax=Clostridium homopropionicum DSM 5847 TaxID=1121318 RepID=A0A0L6Z5F5_9CLOT|nr:YcdB/YcdC domain-containing protein [Clostridium homopropionicum]KOA18194.1 peptidase propeptide and YPEB domain protein [Clostridium homopropionicum DSM 5847]SFF71492.1 hypothetical protein SAMN04488501_101409 [Clostridium homopropionicum]